MKSYSVVKDSGIEWIGPVPEIWNIIRLKYVTNITGGSTPKSDNDKFWDGDIVWITPADLGKIQEKFIGNSKKNITNLGLESCSAELAPPESVVVSTRAPIGHVALTTTNSCTNQGCKTIVCQNRIHSTYLYYLIKSAYEELSANGKGTTFIELSTYSLKNILIVFPDYNLQTQIANFLDHKTTQIDNLINIKQKQIELLKEQRAAIISNAVTGKIDVRDWLPRTEKGKKGAA